MTCISDKEIAIDIYLKVTNDGDKNAYEIVEEHIKIVNENPLNYTWWGNNQNFSPNKLAEFKENGHNPKALIVIPESSGGSGNIEFVADIIDSIKFEGKGVPDDEWRPKYYFSTPRKVFLKLANFKKVKEDTDYDVRNYYIQSNDKRLVDTLYTQYACGYVYRMQEFVERNDRVKEYEGTKPVKIIGEFNDENEEYPNKITEEVDNPEKYTEGATKQVYVNVYERNPVARRKCIEHYGYSCVICDFNFEKIYGELGKDFIHVHHLKELHTIGEEYEVDPIADLRPVCPNCHAMLHKRKQAYFIEELKGFLTIK
ncbi:HNH endonuclease [Bacillus mycoides]|uniref:HNH endonuclease n=1 Tax=Bacillus cereus group TaxID=86661 RepID=UPI0020CDAEDC|nr:MULTISPECIES: HNH endonuclease [Bacillus cereus group]MED1269657.1 HNH endonuclease [Bacillus mycoides]